MNMHGGDTVAKGPPLLRGAGRASSQRRIWVEGPRLVFFKKGFEGIPARETACSKAWTSESAGG